MMKLSRWQKMSFGSGAFSKDIFSVVVTSYLMIFYTDVFGLTASLAGIVLLVTRLIDAFSNPFIGTVMDRTQTRWGRFRPWLFIVPIPFCIFTGLMFWVPDLSPTMKFIYALIVYNIAGLCFTCIDVAIWGLVPNLTRDATERSQLIALSRAFSNVAGMIVAPLVLPLIYFFGGENNASGFMWIGLLVGILSILFSWMLFFTTRELPVAATVEKKPFVAAIRQAMSSIPVRCVVLAMITFGLSVGLQNSVGIYYLKYYMVKPDLIPIYILVSYTCKVIGSLCAPIIISRAGNSQGAKLTYMCMGAICMVMIFAPVNFPVIYFILAGMFSVGIGILLVAITGMMAETSDSLEKFNGHRSDGMLFSLNALSMQMGFAVSAAVAGFILDYAGYMPNVAVQSDSALLWINLVRCAGPAFFCWAVVVIFYIYQRSMTDKKNPIPTAYNFKQENP
ncbi:glycoside-pentoside-hexuronide (GPH):cation symporter [Pseudescherichia sp.]|uniref:MFS transporter n=1 Tax=Pseudescherichia sp. TaxID=2055881 RepID=UPI00289F64D8|nr:glycoside-pentoside-hexuronide (GPH):cation symporter [Pseudescherichia sp.]